MKHGAAATWVLIVVSVLMTAGIFTAKAVSIRRCICHNYRNNPHEVCSDDDSYREGHQNHLNSGFDAYGTCVSPTVTPRPTTAPSPTVTPHPSETPTTPVTPSPTATPEPTPTDDPKPTRVPPDETPTVAPEPTKIPQREDRIENNQSSQRVEYVDPQCNGVYTDEPILQHLVRVNPTTIEIGWWPPVGGADKYSVVYGYYGDPDMGMGVAHLDPSVTRLEINQLQRSRPVNVQVWAWRGKCVSRSAIVDP